MSRDWTEAELQAASEEMKRAGHMGYEEFCEELERQCGGERQQKEKTLSP